MSCRWALPTVRNTRPTDILELEGVLHMPIDACLAEKEAKAAVEEKTNSVAGDGAAPV